MEKEYSLYIHIPYCISKCRYCDFFSKACNNGVPPEYIKALKNEIECRLTRQCRPELKCRPPAPPVIKTIYIGGGTPSLLTIQQLSEILDTVNKCAQIKENCEITIELNPDDVTPELLQNLEKVGITRLSVGIQSMNEEVLKFAGRRASAACNLKALNCIKENWHRTLSLDLICALPGETALSFADGLNTVCGFEPEHISLYSLTIEDETPFGRMYNNGEFEYDWDAADEMWLEGRKILEQNGYFQYEVSNFCKPGFECQHNLTYWNHEDYFGVGAGGTGTIYPDRWTNSSDLDDYVHFWGVAALGAEQQNQQVPEIKEIIQGQTAEFEFFMMGLRKLSGVKESAYKKYFNKDFPVRVVELFEKWQKNGLAQFESAGGERTFCLNGDGILFLNKLLEELEV